MGRTKLVKLFEAEYATLVGAQKELMHHGINSLPEELRKNVTDFALGNIVEISARMLINWLESKVAEN